MKISHDWLQAFFKEPLPPAEELAHALTFHAFEIESIEPLNVLAADGDTILDVKVTPNRGHDCLSYRGIAKEVSAILDIPLIPDSHAASDIGKEFTMQMPVSVTIADPKLCARYIVWVISGVKVGPSPKWLVDRLTSQGQQSINNVVDATNFVMFNYGQPLHAFDASKLTKEKNGFAIEVRNAVRDEKLTALDQKEYTLKDSMLVIVDGNIGVPIGIAGVKGGRPAGISETTTDIIIESANFDGVSIRKTAQALKLRTDASLRFEQVISSELAAEGMRAAAKLILELAGGELAGFADEYPTPQQEKNVLVSLEKINSILGTSLTAQKVEDAFRRLGLIYQLTGTEYSVEVPFERLDLNISEDIVEEVGRLVGYDKVPAIELPPIDTVPVVNANFYAAEKVRQELTEKGYSEVITSVFVEKGERQVLNKVDGARPYLRATLIDGLKDAHEKNNRNRDLLGQDAIRLFEIGTVWSDNGESVMVGVHNVDGVKEQVLIPESAKKYENSSVSETARYQPFSRYPFIVRDIAMWVSAETKSEEVLEILERHAGDLLVRIAKFDEFKKGDKVSYAFRLVFQSMDRTLFDGDANERMESIQMAVKEKGWEVR